MGGKARLPEPPRKLGKHEAAIVRGHADASALKLACHDAAIHRRLQPVGQQARAVFEAVEQARVEAIGARRMDGVAKNLSAMLDERFMRLPQPHELPVTQLLERIRDHRHGDDEEDGRGR